MDVVQGVNIWKRYKEAYVSLIRLGLPVLITQLGSIIVGFADTMMVGDYGTNELAAAAFVNNLFVVPIVMQMGFAGGVTPLVGALFGKGDNEGVGRMLRIGLRLNVLLGVVFTLVMGTLYFFLDSMGQDPELLPYIRPYYLIVLGSMLVGSVFFPCMQMCNGVTDTATPMWIILGGNVMNVAGNYMLIYGRFGAPELGLVGAGISTLAARLTVSVVMILIILSAKRYAPYRSGLRMPIMEPGQRKKMFVTSFPVMIQAGIETLLWTFGAIVCGWFDKYQIAGYQVVLTINQLGFMIYMSAATATSIRVANYMGQNDLPHIRIITKAGLHLNLMLALAASTVFYFAGSSLLGLFTPDATVRAVGEALIIPLVLYQFFDAVQMVYGNALRGTSRVMPLILTSVVSYVVVGITVMLLLAVGLDMKSVGVYYSFSAALAVAAVMLRHYFLDTINRRGIEKADSDRIG